MPPEELSGESPPQGLISPGDISPNCWVTSRKWPWPGRSLAQDLRQPRWAVPPCRDISSGSSGCLGRGHHVFGDTGKVLPLSSFLSSPSIPSPGRPRFHRPQPSLPRLLEARALRLFGAGAKPRDPLPSPCQGLPFAPPAPSSTPQHHPCIPQPLPTGALPTRAPSP